MHQWLGEAPHAPPVLLIHGFASSTLFNWVKTGWLDPLAALSSSVISVDLPGHGASHDVDPTGLRGAELLNDISQIVDDLPGPVALHGYSLGARLAWQFAAEFGDHTSALVMGGPPVSDEVYRIDAAQARAWARNGVEPEDEATRQLAAVASALPGQNLPHVVELRLALLHDRYDPAATVPEVPTLVVAGTKDPIAAGAHRLAELVTETGAPSRYVELTGRSHINAVTARDYKTAVADFLGG